MIHTEKVAKKLKCPMTTDGMVPIMCIASKCMWWLWIKKNRTEGGCGKVLGNRFNVYGS